MEPGIHPQDAIRCDLCREHTVQMYCSPCLTNLCKKCVGEHLSNNLQKHDIVDFYLRKSKFNFPRCDIHRKEQCEMYCVDCNTPVCPHCVTSITHERHCFRCIQDMLNSKKEFLEKEESRIRNSIYPKYADASVDIKTHLNGLNEEYGKLTCAVNKQGEEWHREIDVVVKALKDEINQVKQRHSDIMLRNLNFIKKLTSGIEITLSQIKEILKSNDVLKCLSFEICTEDFQKDPPWADVKLPAFVPHSSPRQLSKLFGSLTPISITTQGYSKMIPDSAPSSPLKQLLDEPALITSIYTGYISLNNVTCLNDEEIWIGNLTSEIKCFNVSGSLLNSISTKSGKSAMDLALTNTNDLLYTDTNTGTVNIVRNGQTEELIQLQDWVPQNLCVTFHGDILVTMYNVDITQCKLVRYSGSTMKQTIQFDDEGKPLYSVNNIVKHVSENRNLDICVADCGAGAVVVVSQSGKLRYRYTSQTSVAKKNPFKPHGITTDSQGQILTADSDNHCIHILDQYGQFLRSIDNCDLCHPYGICVDKDDSLYVAQFTSGKIKKIEYMK
ncbi:uncharacterized protein LOC133192706 [Saccostrea echinata]|uniref:uncharacterized protein LOC133192706 n=1 Tax=Saccostrea echinata TaxID=191078 RepID=UPI002A83B307|nr:uncharacterized protein LOC133192706 [Saccostrea echinata]